MPNNVEMTDISDAEIIAMLGGVTKVARMLGIKPPSVHEWLKKGIPEIRLRELAAQVEIESAGRFSRKSRWPEKYRFYWPELGETSEVNAEGAAHA